MFCRYEITTGRYEELIFAPGKTNDNKLEAQAKPLPANSLHLADMGFFDTERFAEEVDELSVLYSVRWQIELVFKLWLCLFFWANVSWERATARAEHVAYANFTQK